MSDRGLATATQATTPLEGDRVVHAFKTNRMYFRMMGEWHAQHGGAALESDIVSLLEKILQTPILFLDAGCGEGSVAAWIMDRFPKICVHGIDLSPMAVSMAARRRGRRIAFVAGDLSGLPFRGNSYGALHMQSVLEHVLDWERVLEEAYRILTPGGHLVLRTGNGLREGRSAISALRILLTGSARITYHQPSLELSEGGYLDHERNFDTVSIPANLLLSKLRRIGFRILSYSTSREAALQDLGIRKSPLKFLAYRLVAALPLAPFVHLGRTIIVHAKKPS